MAQILLIEADAPLAKNIEQAMSRARHKTRWVVDAQAAINSADQIKPDVIIMDLMLANHSGVEFLHEFRSYPEWSDVPVILLSSLPEHEIGNSSTMHQLDIKKYFYKPSLSLSALAETASSLIKNETTND